jgi:hypothetical protein
MFRTVVFARRLGLCPSSSANASFALQRAYLSTPSDGGDSSSAPPQQGDATKKLGKGKDSVKPLKPSAKLEALLLSMKKVKSYKS